jgi:hypothetical protein
MEGLIEEQEQGGTPLPICQKVSNPHSRQAGQALV